jgi:hypothetical protein
VNKAGSTTTVTSSANPSSFKQAVTFTATVKSVTSGTPTGTVTFKDGASTLGTAGLNGSGVATFATSSLSVGGHSITVAYSGDAHYNASTSTTLTQTVNKASTTTTVASSLNPSTHGQSVTFTATVTPAFGGSPSGTVTFKDGATALGTGALNTTTHKATFTTSSLSIGTHRITAVYGGDTDVNSSASPKLSQVVH